MNDVGWPCNSHILLRMKDKLCLVVFEDLGGARCDDEDDDDDDDDDDDEQEAE